MKSLLLILNLIFKNSQMCILNLFGKVLKDRNKLVITISLIVLISIPKVKIYSQEILNSNDVKLKAPLKIEWEYKTNSILLNQNISGNICYVNTINGIQANSLSDGKELWSYDFPKDKGISSVVTFSDKNAVYISYKKNSSSITLIDLSTGKEKWNLQSDKIWYKPAAMLNDDYVLCLNGPPEEWNELETYFDMKLENSKLTAFKIEDGNQAWETPMEDSQSELLKLVPNYLFVSFDLRGSKSNKILCISLKDGKQKWEYNPSGLFGKALIGGIKVINNAVYTYPQYGGAGQLARVDINSGDERWYVKQIEKQRNFFLFDNTIYNSSKDWQSFAASDGDDLFSKDLRKSSFFIGSLFLNLGANIVGTFVGSFLGKSLAGLIIASSALIVVSIPYLLYEKDSKEPRFIPTLFLFNELQIEDIANNKGLFSVVRTEDEVYYISANLNEDDDEVVEKTFLKEATDFCLSNGTNENSIFATSKGKIYSLSIKDGSIDWMRDYSNGDNETSLGLIMQKDKMYLFTDKRVCLLINE